MALNCQVRIQQRTPGQDDHGQPVDVWADVCTVWADLRHPSGAESIKAGAEVSAIRVSAKVRRRPGITPAMRMVHGTTVYNITAVLPDEVDRQHLFLVGEFAQ